MRRLMMIVLPLALALGSCAGGTSNVEAVAEPTTTAAEIATAANVDVSATGQATLFDTRLVTDLVYHETDDRFSDASGLTDVIAPDAEGTWPTVVVFHGDPRVASKTWHRVDATEIASHGRVVFLPAWGHTTLSHGAATLDSTWDLMVREVSCAVAFAAAHAEEFGGDPEHITLYGLSAGGNAVLMAGLAGAEPLETCAAVGPAVLPQALVPIDADWVLGGDWDTQLSENPEAFYSMTPWRHLDGSQDLRIHVMVTEDQALVRNVGTDPAASWLSYRHIDVDLAAELEAMGLLDDGMFGVVESGEYGYEVLIDAGYDATLITMPGARHSAWGEEGQQLVVETVLRASAADIGEDG